MGKLQGFHKESGDKQPGQTWPQQRPARPEPRPEPQAPAQRPRRDSDIRHLAELFIQSARADGIELRWGLPVVCKEINALVELWHMRTKTFPHYSDACQRRLLPDTDADKCWYHPRSDVRQRNLAWWEVVEVIMAEFWSRRWDEHALDHFRQYFAEFGRAAVTHWASLSAIEAINARPRPPREIMRRKKSGATMPDTSKEGE